MNLIAASTGFATILFVSPIATAGATAAKSESQHPPAPLAAAVAGYDLAQIKGNRRGLERYLADDYLLVNGGGDLETKAQLIADYTAPGFKMDPYVVESPIIKVWPGGAIFGGEVHLSGEDSGKRFAVHARFADVWRLRGRRWQVVYTQVTRLTR